MDTNDAQIATVLAVDGRLGLRFQRRLRHPREKVWRALTEAEHLQHWLPCDIVGERRAGAAIELPFWPAQVERYSIEVPVLHGTISVWDPPSVFEWSWDTDQLRWELDDDAGGTKLTFTTWFGDPDPALVTGAGAGYHVCLDQLADLLDHGTVPPLEDADVSRLEATYAAAVTAAAD